ncbi:MAG: flavodoxin family protein [Defluviitaleaceae bacterium]|nr:flavodoxin family protein [Defluviitaleaceae bacterium]
MVKTLVLQDINLSGLDLDKDKYIIFKQSQSVKPCVGCFGCWVKTPGKCVIKDSDSDFAVKMPHVEEVIIISELVFGGLSPNVKAVLDRSIGFILPFFCKVNGEMHHKQRYDKRPNLKYMLYGEKMPEAEKVTAQKLIKANATNLGADKFSVEFYNSTAELLEDLKQ